MSLSQYLGKKVILYFYPKDNTPGCTKQACSFRDSYDDILDLGAVVMGISKDTLASHTKFQEKHGLPFYLLSDKESDTAEKYGVWGEKKMCGRVTIGMKRTTFVVDEEGKIINIYPKVKTDTHGGDIVEYLKSL